MATITANTTDGFQASGLIPSWDETHDMVNAPQSVDINDTANRFFGIRVAYASARAKYYVVRTFFDWNVSSISGTVTSATINVKTYLNNSSSPGIVLKSGHDPSNTGTNWYGTWLTGLGGTLTDWEEGEDYVIPFSDATATAGNGSFTSFTLNADALTYLNSIAGGSTLFKVVIMDHTNDFEDSAPTGINVTGYYYADHGTSGNRPYLDYTAPSVGYGNDVIGVASGDISKINGIPMSEITKVNGV